MLRINQINQVSPSAEKTCLTESSGFPFVKWAGGKRQLVPEISKYIPERISTYWEPFVGGGAAFFAFSDRMGKAILSDVNVELILTYQAVKAKTNRLIELLKEHQVKHSKNDSYYSKIRQQKLTPPKKTVEIAARFIYLNKTCFNGLYRVNKSGNFNVPKGKYKNPNICDVERLKNASKALQKATLKIGDFQKRVNPSSGDFIYCDPPYHECFANYHESGFTEEDHKKLRDCVKKWSNQGAKVLVSNSDTPFIRKTYAGFNINEVKASRNINSDSSNRTGASELLITYGSWC